MADNNIIVQSPGPQGPSGTSAAGTNMTESPAGVLNLSATVTGLTSLTSADVTVTDDLQVDDDVTLASGSVFTWATDTNLYRSAADTLKTDDSLVVATDLTVTGDITLGDDMTLATGSVLTWNADTNLYRSAADLLKTDDSVEIAGGLKVTGNATTVDTQVTSGTTTSTSYTATLTGGTACGLAFTAPPSGQVLVHNNCRLVNSGIFLTFCTIRVRTGSSIGSGSDVVATSDENAVTVYATTEARIGNTYLVTGLTPGSSYNVQQLFRVVGGTGTFLNKSLIVQKII